MGWLRHSSINPRTPTCLNYPRSPPTFTGRDAILGTPAYMSPEQARGKVLDERTDIWAFGCVLYAMLSSKSAFAEETLTATIAAVVGRDPDWSALPSGTPDSIRSLLRRCLEKDVRRRLHHMGDVRIEIEDAIAAPMATKVDLVPEPKSLSGYGEIWPSSLRVSSASRWSLRSWSGPSRGRLQHSRESHCCCLATIR